MTPSNQRFRKAEHLRRPVDFRRVYDYRCSVRDEWLALFACPNELSYARVGFSVARRLGQAVHRNRIRRLYREAFRLMRAQLPVGFDFVLIPRTQREPDLSSLKQALITLTAELVRKIASRKKPS